MSKKARHSTMSAPHSDAADVALVNRVYAQLRIPSCLKGSVMEIGGGDAGKHAVSCCTARFPGHKADRCGTPDSGAARSR
jgi:hypothetical protein